MYSVFSEASCTNHKLITEKKQWFTIQNYSENSLYTESFGFLTQQNMNFNVICKKYIVSEIAIGHCKQLL